MFLWPNAANCAAARAMPAGVISGYWPFGGSVMIEVRHLPSILITLSPGSM